VTGELLKTLAPMMHGMMGGEGDAKKQAEAAIDALIAAGNTGSYGAATGPTASVQVQTFDDPAKATSAMLALFRAAGEGGTYGNAYLKGKPEIKENAEDYKGIKLSSVRLTWDFDKFAEAFPAGGDAIKDAMKKLMGDELRLWFGTDGKRVVTVTAKDWDSAKARLDALLGGATPLASDPAYKATRTHLPAETTLLMLADAGRFTYIMADYIVTFAKGMPGLPFQLPAEVKPVTTKTSYLGFAVTLRPENATFDMFVPTLGVQEMRKVLMPLFQGAQ
jgi:hypothetical protein